MWLNRMKGGVLGLAVGDALGLPVEGMERGELEERPVKSMRGCGAHGQAAGAWSKNTSQTLAMLDSLKDGFDPENMMLRLSQSLDGRYSAYGNDLFADPAVRRAVDRHAGGVPAAQCGDERGLDNGALKRMLPMAFYLYPMAGTSIAKSPHAMEMIRLAASLTNRHPRGVVACGLYVGIACALIAGMDIPEAIGDAYQTVETYYQQSPQRCELPHFRRLADVGALRSLRRREIFSCSGAVQTLEAALYCLLNTRSFAQCALMAVNLGDETCAVASLACSLAGLVYGPAGIPASWLMAIPGRGDMESLCGRLFEETVLRA